MMDEDFDLSLLFGDEEDITSEEDNKGKKIITIHGNCSLCKSNGPCYLMHTWEAKTTLDTITSVLRKIIDFIYDKYELDFNIDETSKICDKCDVLLNAYDSIRLTEDLSRYDDMRKSQIYVIRNNTRNLLLTAALKNDRDDTLFVQIKTAIKRYKEI